MGRSPCHDEINGLKKGPWTPEEDQILVQYIQTHGHGSWRALPKLAGLNRCGKSCRLRWTNYLRPDIKRGKFSQEEEQTILNLHSILGNKWSAIATHLPGRTDNEIKNFWNTHLKKKLIQMGFDPMTHRPRTDFFAALPQLIFLANLIDGRPWDDHAARLQAQAQAEATQAAAKLHCFQHLLQSASALPNVSTADLENMSLPSIPSPTPPQCLTDNHDQMNQLPSIFFEPSVSNETGQCSTMTGFSQGEDSCLPPLAYVSVANQGDACSISSSNGDETPYIWPEFFLDDQFMTGFA
ncbi:hypothetical protein OPV22_005395 [Ensete ventricosum]|uniref:Uncharacterized protein n=1 Tax=Ensete ventricosum TaxID=4639 RepID=A0AAV8RMF6_ENSVE|nr:hypothetical protein OPV22_005395 [Ensete ventricosum]